MPTWGEIQQYARSKYKLADDEADWFAIVFEYDDGRTQKIAITRFEAFDKEWIEFASAVCKGTQIPATEALRRNADFVLGSLALDAEGDISLMYSAPLDTMDPDEFEIPLHVIARTADELEQEFARGGDDF